MSYVIAIPSYKRPDIIKTHTLNVLLKGGINPGIITIFVANKTEYNEYRKGIPNINIVIGKKGMQMVK
jgi:hypothetical protein